MHSYSLVDAAVATVKFMCMLLVQIVGHSFKLLIVPSLHMVDQCLQRLIAASKFVVLLLNAFEAEAVAGWLRLTCTTCAV